MKSLIQCLIAFSFFAYANTGLGACNDPEIMCTYIAPGLIPGASSCLVTGFCEGEDCMHGARGDYILVSSSDDPEDVIYDGYTTRWLARHPGVMQNLGLGPFDCELIDHRHGSFVILPEASHCATMLSVGPDDVYVEFFASIPDWCHGWAECRCE